MCEKICNTCHKSKPLSEYRRRETAPDGYDYRCKPCHKVKARMRLYEPPTNTNKLKMIEVMITGLFPKGFEGWLFRKTVMQALKDTVHTCSTIDRDTAWEYINRGMWHAGSLNVDSAYIVRLANKYKLWENVRHG